MHVQVMAVVPLSDFGGEDVLVIRENDRIRLPAGSVEPGERLFEAAIRVVREQAGFEPVPVRVVYLLEGAGGMLDIAVLCELPELDESDELRGEFATLSRVGEDFQPLALLEIMVEDLRSGFVRPVAHVVESTGTDGPRVNVSW